jgi:hypothetical protein
MECSRGKTFLHTMQLVSARLKRFKNFFIIDIRVENTGSHFILAQFVTQVPGQEFSPD